MEYIQTRDILSKACDFHHKLSHYYDEERQRLDEQKVKLLLEYLSRHEKNLEALLKRCSEDAEPSITNTWFKYTPDHLSEAMDPDVHIPADSTVDDIVQIALNVDNKLIEFYNDAAERAMSRDVRELFEKLARQEENEEHRLAKGVFGEL